MSVTFIIPCFNSKNIILKNFLKLSNFVKENKIDGKIIYINDGSGDSTINELQKIKNKKIEIINNKKNLGKSYSIIKALDKIETKNVILIDCDLPYFSSLKKVINNLNFYDLVIVNRKIPGSKNIDKKKIFIKFLDII